MISLTTLNADTNGVIMIDDYNSNFGSLDSRISRQATLDGGVVITHSGVIHGDRTFDISADIDSDQKTILEYLHGNNTILRLSCIEGLFTGAISTLKSTTPEMTFKFLVKDKEA